MKQKIEPKATNLIEQNLDPLSDRYRICPHPQCKKPHMITNRGRDYCCDKHADDHYNLLRRLKAQTEKMMNSNDGKTIELESVPAVLPLVNESKFSAEKQKLNNISTTESGEGINMSVSANNVQIIKTSSRKILQRLLGEKDELVIHINELAATGFIIESFDKLIPLKDSMLYIALYDDYALFWDKEDELVLTNLKHILWVTE